MTTNEELIILVNYLFHDNPRRIWDLINRFSSLEDFKKGLLDYLVLKKAKNIEKTRQKLTEFDFTAFNNSLNKNCISTLFFHSNEYPSLLKQIPAPPPVLYFQGQLQHLSGELFAVVGPRAVSEYGEAVTSELTKELLGYFTIVSGMAGGVDTIAHSTALYYNKPTIAVVGTGLDMVYPSSNKNLHKNIIANGLVLSEYPPCVEPLAYNFPQRNRIISGISKGVLVTEGNLNSGALITARLAADQNREVFAVPGPIFSKNSCGVHKIIQEGAKLVHNIEDILSEFNYLIKPRKGVQQLKSIEVPQLNFSSAAQNIQSFSLSEDEKKVLDALSQNPQNIDDIVSNTNLSIHQVLQYLSFFEINEIVEQLPGKFFQLKNTYLHK
ncbi:DNA-processing protein DprA [Candidatus Margulisiibacteriota bacterium]